MKETLIDIETYCEADIKKCGLYRYVSDPSFEILLIAWATDEGSGFGETKLADLASGDSFPQELLDDFKDSNVTLIAHNAAFERVSFSRYLQQHYPGQYLKPGTFLSPNNGMTGICITAEKISLAFAGPLTQEKVSAYTELCAAMNRMASAQKRIQAKTVNDANEKYALRIWLIRLGLNGDEHKSIRKLLMQNLSGHAAFRTEEDAEKFRVKEKAKRDALKAAKQAAHGGVSAAEETAEAAAEAPTQPDCGADGAPQAQEAGA